MKQRFVIAAEGFTVRLEDRQNGVVMEVEFAPSELSRVAYWSDKVVFLRERLSEAQIKQLADWLSDR